MSSKLSKAKVADLLAPTPISRVSDAEIWSLLISPQTKALLGRVESTIQAPTLTESTQALFEGDEVTNLNGHLLYGNSSAARFPYIATVYKTANGVLVVKRDGVKFKASCWLGDPFRGKGEMIYKVALRDRRYDGTLRANDSALLDFPYDDVVNAPLPGDARSVEVSIYAFIPGSRISQTSGDTDLEAFVANPFVFVDRPEFFLEQFQKAWRSNRAPGQVGAPIPDVARFVGPRFDKVAMGKGYDFLEDAASHYHVVMFALAMGFRFTYAQQEAELAALKTGIESLKGKGVKLTRPQESWVCVLQSLPVDRIPEKFYLGGPRWLQDNISQDNLWMHKALSPRARQLFAAPLESMPSRSKLAGSATPPPQLSLTS